MRHLNRFALTALTMLSLTLSAQAAEVPADVQAKLKEMIDSGYGVGAVVAVVDAKGPSYFSYGKLKADGKPVDSKTLFEIGSISKVFTALTLARLAEKGVVKIDEPAQLALPAEVKLPVEGARQITLRDLATHTSGLPPLPSSFQPQDLSNPYADFNEQKLFSALNQIKLLHPIGSTYQYSNLGVGLLGHILGLRTGKSYETLVQWEITGPLKMKDTAITLGREQIMRLATGHNGSAPTSHWDFESLAGAGALRSNAEDLSLFLNAAMGLTPSNLNKALAQMAQPLAKTDIPGMQIGLGWHVLTMNEKQYVWHNGGTGGFRSFIGYDSQDKRGVLVLANSTTISTDELGMHLLESRIPLPQLRKPIALKPEAAAVFVGNYEFGQIGLKMQITQQGSQLLATFSGQGTVTLYPSTPTRFFVKEVEAEIEFLRDAKGQITGARLYQGGQTVDAKRL